MPSVIASAPAARNSSQIASVMPKPPAAFSPLTTTKSSRQRWRSAGSMVEKRRAAGAADDVADEQQPHQPAPVASISSLSVRMKSSRWSCGSAGTAGDFATPHRRRRPRGSGPRARNRAKRAIVVAGAVADAMAAPVESGERHEQQVGIDDLRRRRRLGNAHRAGDQSARRAASGGRPAARRARAVTGKAVAKPSRCRARRAAAACPARRGSSESGDDAGRQRRAQSSPISASRARERGAGRGDRRRAALERRRRKRGFGVSQGRRIGTGMVAIECADPLRKARSRESRWTVIPGAYVSRWEPCAQAHGRGQGQPPLGSYGPEECGPDAPPSSAGPI